MGFVRNHKQKQHRKNIFQAENRTKTKQTPGLTRIARIWKLQNKKVSCLYWCLIMDGLRCLCASANHIIAKCVLFGFLCFCFLCFREKRVILRGFFFPVGLSCVAYRLGSRPWSSGSARTQRLKLRFFSRLFFLFLLLS